jgi:hypothetical protein
MKLKFREAFHPSAKVGDVAIVDKIKCEPSSKTGVMVRVVNIWKKPTYLDLGFFIDTKGIETPHYKEMMKL